jgi:hypothetical protein
MVGFLLPFIILSVTLTVIRVLNEAAKNPTYQIPTILRTESVRLSRPSDEPPHPIVFASLYPNRPLWREMLSNHMLAALCPSGIRPIFYGVSIWLQVNVKEA